MSAFSITCYNTITIEKSKVKFGLIGEAALGLGDKNKTVSPGKHHEYDGLKIGKTYEVDAQLEKGNQRFLPGGQDLGKVYVKPGDEVYAFFDEEADIYRLETKRSLINPHVINVNNLCDDETRIKFCIARSIKNKCKTLSSGQSKSVDSGWRGEGFKPDKDYRVDITNDDSKKKVGSITVQTGMDVYVYNEGGGYKISKEYPEHKLGSEGSPGNEKIILFAHGMNDSSKAWDQFTKHAGDHGWTVYRRSVAEDGTIQTRGRQLAQYINAISAKNDIEDAPIVIVAHSLGGLDARLVVGEGNKKSDDLFVNAAKKIKAVYTIATPHKGNMMGGLTWFSRAHAQYDLGKSQMSDFNDFYKYEDFEVEGRGVNFCALVFSCPAAMGYGDGDGWVSTMGGDGVVSALNQQWAGAPCYPKYNQFMRGSHASGKLKLDWCEVETKQNKVLDLIFRWEDETEFEKEEGKKAEMIDAGKIAEIKFFDKKGKEENENEYTILDQDLNDGAGGDYIFLGFKREQNPAKVISRIFIRNKTKKLDLPAGGDWKCATDIQGKDQNLNRGGGENGDNLWLYYQEEAFDPNKPIDYLLDIMTLTTDKTSVDSGSRARRPGYEILSHKDQNTNRGMGKGENIWICYATPKSQGF